MGRISTIGSHFIGNDLAIPVARKSPVKVFMPSQEADEIVEVKVDIKPANTPTHVTAESTTTISNKSHLHWVIILVVALGILGALTAYSIYQLTTEHFKMQAAEQQLRLSEVKATEAINAHNEFVSKVAKIENQPLSIAVDGSVVKASSEDIQAFINKSGLSKEQLSLNSQAIDSYVNSIATKYDAAPVNRVVIDHSDGTSAVIAAGANGYTIPQSSITSAESQISANLASGGGMNVELNGASVPYQTQSTPAGYNFLLEADVTTERMYAYQDGNLVRTFLITAGAPATPTPIGTFHIWEKLPIQDMTGYNPNGTKYNQPNVQWIMYFDHSGDAVHGNYWRPLSVFGNVSTSHGCLGVVNPDAEWLYNWAPIGTTVVTHT